MLNIHLYLDTSIIYTNEDTDSNSIVELESDELERLLAFGIRKSTDNEDEEKLKDNKSKLKEKNLKKIQK